MSKFLVLLLLAGMILSNIPFQAWIDTKPAGKYEQKDTQEDDRTDPDEPNTENAKKAADCVLPTLLNRTGPTVALLSEYSHLCQASMASVYLEIPTPPPLT
jgi:hypothetical protein